MYERFYNLRERPFSLSPDPDYLYPSRVHKEALSYLRYGIEGHAGFILITGEIGCGKTTLLQALLRGLDRQTSVSRLINTMLDARELLEAVMLDFGIDLGQGRSKPHLLRDLARFLVGQRSAGRLALLVIDEAQNLGLGALEEVRMLSNLETEKSKLIQIVLVGQPSLRDLLGRPELEQLRQRVTVSYHLEPLDADETGAYINHRLRRAAIGAPLEFSRDVTDLIHLHSQGVPRKINVIADAVLLFGYGEEQRAVGVELANEAIEELESTGVISPAPIGSAASRRVVPPTPAAADRDRDAALREARVAERERQLAEQQRILLEEYRLLRLQRSAQAAALQDRSKDAPQPAVSLPDAAPHPLAARAAEAMPLPRDVASPSAVTSAPRPITAFQEPRAPWPPRSPAAAAPGWAIRLKSDGPPERPVIRLNGELPRQAVAPSATPASSSRWKLEERSRGSFAAVASDPVRSATIEDAVDSNLSGTGWWTRLRRGLFGAKPAYED